MFNSEKKKLKKLIESDRYKNSIYQIQKVNGMYGLNIKESNTYVDLVSNPFTWQYGSTYTRDCFGSIEDVIRAFNFVCPIIEPLNIEEKY